MEDWRPLSKKGRSHGETNGRRCIVNVEARLDMPKISNKSATKMDKLVGQNIRARRLEMGMTQQQLSAKLGVTFQQLQKYENGINRVGSGRLHQIAEILEVPVKSLFEGGSKHPADSHTSPFSLLDDPMTLEMAREFAKIKDNKTRRGVLAVVEGMVAKSKG